MIDYSALLQHLGWWALFGLVHSITARPEIKDVSPLKGRSYRLAYNLVSVLTLAVVLTRVPAITPLIMEIAGINGISWLHVGPMLLGSVVIGSLGLLGWNIPAFLGLADDDDELQTTGIFALSRHPVYSGILLFLLTLAVIDASTASLSWLLGAGGYFVLGTVPEEDNLDHYFEEYSGYRNNVGRFFPWRGRHLNYLRSMLSDSQGP